jgi:hypothetical protein
MVIDVVNSSEVDLMPALPVHALSPIHSTAPTISPEPVDEENPSKVELNRSASFTYLSGPGKDGPASLKRTFSENVLSFQSSRSSNKVSDSMQSANKELFRRASRKTKKRLSRSKFTFPTDDDDSEKESHRANAEMSDAAPSATGLARSVTGTIRSLARRSWLPNSRSSSPAKQDDESLDKQRSWSPAKRRSLKISFTFSTRPRRGSRSLAIFCSVRTNSFTE